MRRKVVHGDLHALAQLELAQRVRQQAEVEGVWVVEVVVVVGGQVLLLRGQDLSRNTTLHFTTTTTTLQQR